MYENILFYCFLFRLTLRLFFHAFHFELYPKAQTKIKANDCKIPHINGVTNANCLLLLFKSMAACFVSFD